MSQAIPSGFIPIDRASNRLNQYVSLMGVVTDYMPPVKSRGKDWTCSFCLVDSTVNDEGLRIRVFKELEADLPFIYGTGDVVALKSIKISNWSGMVTGLSNVGTEWTVFPADSIPDKVTANNLQLRYIKNKGSVAPLQQEMRYAVQLCNSRNRNSYTTSSTLTTPSSTSTSFATSGLPHGTATLPTPVRRDKFSLIKDVEIDKFYDLVVQVVKLYRNNGVVELYVTDYTSHKGLFNYEWGRSGASGARDGDEFGYAPSRSTDSKWPGPFGQRTLMVNLWPPHSDFAQYNVKENDIVFLRNTRIKFSRDAKVEGSLFPDQKYEGRVDVSVIREREDDRVKELLRKKLAYTKQFQSESETLVDEARGEKRKQPDAKLSKAENRRRKKLQKQAQNKRAKASNDKENMATSFATTSTPYQEYDQTPPSSPPPIKVPKISELNKNIRTTKPNIPTRSLSSILSRSTHALTTPQGTPFTLPFQNINSRAAVRVVDFYPSNLEDFAIQKKSRDSEFEVLSEYESSSSSSSDGEGHVSLPKDTSDEEAGQSGNENEEGSPSKSRWEWRFSLTLEDPMSSGPKSPTVVDPDEGRMTVYVSGSDAEFLLRLDACNLRRSPQTLAQLREKLFILWGDLEEWKTKQLESSERPLQVEQGAGNAGRAQRPRCKAFECCLKEYGVRNRKAQRLKGHPILRGSAAGSGEDGSADEDDDVWREENGYGWERKFAMFGTTIM